MFGRRKREAEAANEAERRALFAELAKRPDTICPFLGLAESRTEYHEGVSDEHRCYAFGDPAELSSEQQTKVCLQRGYGNCPRYLRGVLVIPTEELEALRHPQAPEVVSAPASAGAGGGRRRGLIAVVLVLLIAIGGGGAAFALLQGGGVAVAPTPTPVLLPSPSQTETTVPTPSEPPSTTAAATPTPLPTPIVLPSAGPTIPPLPTPGPDDRSTGYAVFVVEGDYAVYRLNDNDEVTGEATAVFGGVSAAPVRKIVAAGGTIYWRTSVGEYSGLAYVRGVSGDFSIYETFETPTGEARFSKLPDDQT